MSSSLYTTAVVRALVKIAFIKPKGSGEVEEKPCIPFHDWRIVQRSSCYEQLTSFEVGYF